jgi:hypothetical protein
MKAIEDVLEVSTSLHTDKPKGKRLTYGHGEAKTFTLTIFRYGSTKRRKEIKNNERQNTKCTYDVILRHVFVITAPRNK